MSNNKDFKVKNGIQATVYHEAVGTVVSNSEGYSLGSASYDGKSLSVASQETGPQTIFIGDSNTKFYTLGGNSRTVYQYNATTASDISTASYASKSFDVSTQDTGPTGLSFNSTGTKMYVCGSVNDTIYQYTLTTAWDVSTASYDSVSFSVSSQDTVPTEVTFGDSGTKMYVLGITNDKIFQYSLTTAYDLSTASYASKSFSVANEETDSFGFDFASDGTKVFVYGIQGDAVFQYSLSTAWDISTASYDTVSLDTSSNETAGRGVAFNSDGSQLYIVGAVSDTIYQYSTVLTTASLDLSSGSVFEITPTSDVQVTLTNPAANGTSSGATLLLEGGSSAGYDLANAEYSDVSFSVASQDTNPFGMAFSNDGTKMYVVGQSTDTIYQYSLSTAFDLNTASYSSVNLNVNSQDPEPSGMAFNSDGTKMYVVGDTNNSLFQYSLSTGFDLSTASYDSVSFSVSGQDITPLDVAFNNDGTKMYVLGNTNDTVFQYSLSTAFDLSTASYDSVSFSVGSQESTPLGITFKSDGTKMYVVGRGVDTVFQYSLSTAFDLSTTSYDSVSFSVGGQDTIPYGVVFSNDGTKMYVIGITSDSIYQYSTATPATITYPSTLQWPSGTAPTSPAIGETDVITFNTTDGGTTYKSVVAIDGAS